MSKKIIVKKEDYFPKKGLEFQSLGKIRKYKDGQQLEDDYDHSEWAPIFRQYITDELDNLNDDEREVYEDEDGFLTSYITNIEGDQYRIIFRNAEDRTGLRVESRGEWILDTYTLENQDEEDEEELKLEEAAQESEIKASEIQELEDKDIRYYISDLNRARNKKRALEIRKKHPNVFGEIDPAKYVEVKYWDKESYMEYLAFKREAKEIPYHLQFASLDPHETNLILSHKKPKKNWPDSYLLKILDFENRSSWEEYLSLKYKKGKPKIKEISSTNVRNNFNEKLIKAKQADNQLLHDLLPDFQKACNNNPLLNGSLKKYKLRLDRLFPKTLPKTNINPIISMNGITSTVNEVVPYFDDLFKMNNFDDYELDDEDTPSTTQSIPNITLLPSECRRKPKNRNKNRAYQTTRLSEPKISKSLIKLYKKQSLDMILPCMAAATYFQLLVSSTPVDEDYIYTHLEYRERKLKKKDIYTGEIGTDSFKLKSREEVAAQYTPRIVHHTDYHKADKEIVRADWILEFRGRYFKAFDSEQSKYSEPLPERTLTLFTESDFYVPGAQTSIRNIAMKLYEATKDLDDDSSNFDAFNVNPRWVILEKGGYIRDTKDEYGNTTYNVGISQYGFKHGVTNHHSYQAPIGMKALVDNYYEMTLAANRGYISKFINTTKLNFDVSDISSKIIKKIKKYAPNMNDLSFVKEELQQVVKK